jgi:hypothetical protein
MQVHACLEVLSRFDFVNHLFAKPPLPHTSCHTSTTHHLCVYGIEYIQNRSIAYNLVGHAVILEIHGRTFFVW